jgi:hypothetical protein
MRSTPLLSVLFICTLQVGVINGGVIVSIEDATLAPNSRTFVDVSISSDGAGADVVSATGFEFHISTAGATQLEFVTPQASDYLSEPAYLFVGDSLANSFPPVGSVSTTIVPNDTYIGGDSTNSGGNIALSNQGHLLVRLEITSATALPPTPGDVFSIELVSGLSTFFADSTLQNIAFTSTQGRLIVVPEPAAHVLALFCAFVTMIRASRRRAQLLWERTTSCYRIYNINEE